MRDMMSADDAYCYERARDCAEQARSTRDKLLKADFLDLKARWLALAQSYQSDERPVMAEGGRGINGRGSAEIGRAA